MDRETRHPLGAWAGHQQNMPFWESSGRFFCVGVADILFAAACASTALKRATNRALTV